MKTRSLASVVSFFALNLAVVGGASALAGCNAGSSGSADDDVVSEAQALSSESTSSDPVEDGAVSDEDASAASEEAVESTLDGPEPVEIGCGLRKTIRERIVSHFDKDGDGKLDDGELARDIAPRVQARREKLREALASHDANKDGKLDAAEREALKDDMIARYRAKRAEVKAKFDKDGSGNLDDAELAALKAAIRARFEGSTPEE